MKEKEYIELEEAISEATDENVLKKISAYLNTLPNDRDKSDLLRNIASKWSML